MEETLKMFIPFTKVDLSKREVWGRATQEIADGHGEIMDYLSSAPLFRKWSEDAMQRSGGKSKGNIREMHQPIAAGKVIDMQYNDAEKAIDIGTQVLDEGSWQKVLAGVLTGFSIGGDYAKRWNDGANYGLTRFTASPAEISLVDVPAVPTAVFAMVKMDGSTELHKVGTPIMVDVNKAEGLIEPLINDLDKSHDAAPGIPAQDVPIEMGNTDGAQIPTETVPEEVLSGYKTVEVTADGQGVPDGNDARVQELPVAEDGAAALPALPTETEINESGIVVKMSLEKDDIELLEKTLADLKTAIEKLSALESSEALRKDKVVNELKLRSSRVGITRRESEPLSPSENEPSDWQVYADPVNWKFPLSKRENASTAIAQYNNGTNRAMYTPAEWSVVGRRITRLASNVFGEMYKFNPALKRVEKEIKKENEMQKSDFMGVLRELSAQLSGAVEMIGSNPDAAKDLLVQALGAIDVSSDVAPANPETQEVPSLSAAEAPVAVVIEPEASVPAEKVDGGVMDVLKAMQKQIEALTKAQQTAASAPAQMPLGDVNALLAKMLGQDEVPAAGNEFATVLASGDLNKALALVGNDPQRMYREANQAAVRGIFESGINVQKFQFLATSTEESA